MKKLGLLVMAVAVLGMITACSGKHPQALPKTMEIAPATLSQESQDVLNLLGLN